MLLLFILIITFSIYKILIWLFAEFLVLLYNCLFLVHSHLFLLPNLLFYLHRYDCIPYLYIDSTYVYLKVFFQIMILPFPQESSSFVKNVISFHLLAILWCLRHCLLLENSYICVCVCFYLWYNNYLAGREVMHYDHGIPRHIVWHCFILDFGREKLGGSKRKELWFQLSGLNSTGHQCHAFCDISATKRVG